MNNKNKSKKRALIVSPYLDHLGGGERYMLTLASVIEEMGYEIAFTWDNLEEISRNATMLGIELKSPSLDATLMSLYHSGSPLRTYLATSHYDLTVYLSDGSLPLLGSKKNIIHMQVPFHNVGGRSLKNNIKKLFCHDFIVNSAFTKSVVDMEYGIDSTILYPPVNLLHRSEQKEKMILSVGRFEPSLNVKKQDILISAFKKLSPLFPDWKLVLAGAATDDQWTNYLRAMSVGYPIDFALNIDYQAMSDLYAKAALYWHAAGYGIDEAKNPELTEHFGISTVEAMSAGAVPLVVGKGGQKEIVTNKDLLWATTDELVAKTQNLIKNTSRQSLLAALDMKRFDLSSFRHQLSRIITS